MVDIYGSAVGFITYCSERGIQTISDETIIEKKLVVASEWIDAVYRTLFPGVKVGGREQVREWPRTGAQDRYGYSIPSDSIPSEVICATYEAALEEIAKSGSLSPNYTPAKYVSAAVSGAVSVTYARFNDAQDAQTTFTKVEQWLSGILIDGRDSRIVGSVYRV
jgi:hypothetical protein